MSGYRSKICVGERDIDCPCSLIITYAHTYTHTHTHTHTRLSPVHQTVRVSIMSENKDEAIEDGTTEVVAEAPLGPSIVSS